MANIEELLYLLGGDATQLGFLTPPGQRASEGKKNKSHYYRATQFPPRDSSDSQLLGASYGSNEKGSLTRESTGKPELELDEKYIASPYLPLEKRTKNNVRTHTTYATKLAKWASICETKARRDSEANEVLDKALAEYATPKSAKEKLKHVEYSMDTYQSRRRRETSILKHSTILPEIRNISNSTIWDLEEPDVAEEGQKKKVHKQLTIVVEGECSELTPSSRWDDSGMRISETSLGGNSEEQILATHLTGRTSTIRSEAKTSKMGDRTAGDQLKLLDSKRRYIAVDKFESIDAFEEFVFKHDVDVKFIYRENKKAMSDLYHEFLTGENRFCHDLARQMDRRYGA